MATAHPITQDGFTSSDERRKRLGQYFTGLRPARLLAALAQAERAHSVLDPMVGHGDMLFGVAVHGRPKLLGGIELDPEAYETCATRLKGAGLQIDALVLGSAFSSQSLRQLPTRAWDVVITNPPYVRYQATSRAAGINLAIPSGADIRRDLIATVDELDALDEEDRRLFRELARGYSGLSDMAVPSWILCAGLVRVDGVLAMLVPTTWLSRDYAHPIRYLIDHWFDVLCVVEDGDASWFADALVRTTLVVAKRVPRRPSALRADAAEGHVHVRLTTGMGNAESLVGKLLDGNDDPDVALANLLREWKQAGRTPDDHPLQPRWVQADPERRSLNRSVTSNTPRLLGADDGSENPETPRPLVHSMLGAAASSEYVNLHQLGWRVGQGLRTGANRFFYLNVAAVEGDFEVLTADGIVDGQRINVPRTLTLPALRRQAELPAGFVVCGEELPGRVLILDQWALEEDLAELIPQPYRPLSGSLADLIRCAAQVNVGTKAQPRFIPELSAVAPNVRSLDPSRPDRPARFWYQLPPLTDRHRPSLLVARINSGHPRTLANEHRAAVVDANFSTLWPAGGAVVSIFGLLALLNSAWCVAEMELRGTVLGGGALKLEATHLRQLPFPRLGDSGWESADQLGRELARLPSVKHATAVLDEIDHLVLDAVAVGDVRRSVRRVREIAREWLRRRSK